MISYEDTRFASFMICTNNNSCINSNLFQTLYRFGTGDVSDQPSILRMHDVMDDLEEFTEIPDNFCDLPHEHYPLTITYRKFLMMLDGTCRTSFFDAFYGEMKSSFERGHSRSRAVQTFI